MAGNGEVRRAPRGAITEQGVPARSAAAVAHKSLWPSDLKPTRKIRSKAHRILTLRSRSGGPDPNITVRPVTFAKEPLSFSRFNPQSISVQKYFQLSPFFYVLAPELFPIRTRRPRLLFLRVRPQS